MNYSVALLSVSGLYACDVGMGIVGKLHPSEVLVFPEPRSGVLTQNGLADLELASKAHILLDRELALRSESKSYVTTFPAAMSVALCGQFADEVGGADASMPTRLALMRIQSTIAHLMVLTDIFSYSGVYYLPIEDPDEKQAVLQGYIKLALSQCEISYRTIDPAPAKDVASLIVSRIEEAAGKLQETDEAKDTNAKDGHQISDGRGTSPTGG